MSWGNRTLHIKGSPVREGTALYDTAYYHPLWVTAITGSGVTVEPLSDYEVAPTGGPTTRRERITGDTVFGLQEFKSLVRQGRFEISPR